MKKKLRLQLEKLRVEQFEVQPDSPVARGTVHAFDSVPWHSYSGEEHCICFIMPETQNQILTTC